MSLYRVVLVCVVSVSAHARLGGVHMGEFIHANEKGMGWRATQCRSTLCAVHFHVPSWRPAVVCHAMRGAKPG